jgi:hypothetical protein
VSSAAYFRKKAAQCRRLAASLVNQDDPAAKVLYALADEFEVQAQTSAAREKAARDISPADAVAPKKPKRY